MSSCGIQYRILAVLNAQGPLFIGWGAEWATAVICTDAVLTVNLSRPDGQLCDRIFWKFRSKSFLFKSLVRTVRHRRPDSRTSAASNFHIRLRASGPRGMNVRTAILQHAISISAMCESGSWEVDVRMVEVESVISLTDERASGPMPIDVRTVIFELRFLPYVWVHSDGKPRLPDGVSIFPYLNLERIWSWSITDGRSDGMLRGTDWCKLEQKLLDTVEGLDGKIRRPDGWCWSVWRPNGMTRRRDGWNSGQMGVRTADRESEIFYLQCRVFWKIYDKRNPCLQYIYT
jgi:hypothetical protein